MLRWVAALIGFVLLWLLLACLSAFIASLNDARTIHEQALQERKRFELERIERLKEREGYEKVRAPPVVEAAIRAAGPIRPRSVCSSFALNLVDHRPGGDSGDHFHR